MCILGYIVMRHNMKRGWYLMMGLNELMNVYIKW